MEIREFVRAEVIVLVPVLDFTVHLLRGFVPLKKIPIIIIAMGIVLTGLYEFAIDPVDSVGHLLLTIFSSITQGVLVAGSSLLLAKESLTEHVMYEEELHGEHAEEPHGEHAEEPHGEHEEEEPHGDRVDEDQL